MIRCIKEPDGNPHRILIEDLSINPFLGFANRICMASSANGRNGPPTSDVPMVIDLVNGETEQQQPEEETYPSTCLIDTIFVPLTKDLLQPIEPAKDRAERLERMMASLDANEKKVRNNIACIYEREARRYMAAVKKTGALSAPRQPKPINWEEAETHLANMAAPARPDTAYHLSPERIAEFKAHGQPALLPDDLGHHEKTSREVLNIATRGVTELEYYSNTHIKPIRDRLNASLAREKQASASFDRS